MAETKIMVETNKHEHRNSGTKRSEQGVDSRYRIANNINLSGKNNTKIERDAERNTQIPRREENTGRMQLFENKQCESEKVFRKFLGFFENNESEIKFQLKSRHYPIIRKPDRHRYICEKTWEER